jgi:hypothetical protein
MAPPKSIMDSVTLFLATWIFAAFVSYRLAASSCRAVFSSHARAPSARDCESRSPAPAIFSSAPDTRTSDWPRLSRVVKTSPPSALIRPRPCANISSALAGDALKTRANSSADTPATLANFSRSSEPVLIALDMSMSTLDTAVPPASASIPTEARALDTASRSASVIPTTFAAPAIREAMLRMSFSVLAPLLPRSTRADENRSTPFAPSRSRVPMTLLICAMEVAASSAVRFVVSDRLIMVSVNPRMSPWATPSCPAASATAAISECVDGSVVASPRRPSSRAAISCVDPSTVLVTPAQEDSQSIAAFAARPRAAVMARPPTVAAVPILSQSAAFFDIDAAPEFAMSVVAVFMRVTPAR